MDLLKRINEQSQTKRANDVNDYAVFARPLTAKLLEPMNLDKTYTRGEGDYLYYEKNQNLQNARKISEVPWVTNLSNSGTEAIEAAIKQSQLHFKHKLIEISQQIEKEMNQALIKVQRSESKIERKILLKLKTEIVNKTDELKMTEERRSYFLHQLANVHDMDSLVSLIREINLLQLNQRPKLIALKKAYHGKTLGALSITSNEHFRNDFYLGDEFNTQTIFISAHDDLNTISEVIESTKQDLVFIASGPKGIVISKHSFSLVAGAFAEPIQGEAGVIEVPSQTLAILKNFSLQENFLLRYEFGKSAKQ